MLARDALPAINATLSRLDRGSARASGQRAALWRAQNQAARGGRTLDDLRRYCLESLKKPRVLEPEHENEYLRGYRQGLQLVLNEIRRIETRPRR